MDELSPLFQEIEFHERFRGYDPDEVDAYVDRVAQAAALVHGRLAELHLRVEAAESRETVAPAAEAEETLTRTLVLAQRTADAAVAEAREEAERLTSDASTSAQATRSAAEADAQVTLRAAQAEAAALTQESEDRAAAADEELESARREIIAKAEEVAAAAASVERERLAVEVGELQQYRAFLADDIEILERHVGEERRHISASVAALHDLLDAPESFRSSRAPETSGIEVDESLLEPIVVAPRVDDAVADSTYEEAHLDAPVHVEPLLGLPSTGEPVSADSAPTEVSLDEPVEELVMDDTSVGTTDIDEFVLETVAEAPVPAVAFGNFAMQPEPEPTSDEPEPEPTSDEPEHEPEPEPTSDEPEPAVIDLVAADASDPVWDEATPAPIDEWDNTEIDLNNQPEVTHDEVATPVAEVAFAHRADAGTSAPDFDQPVPGNVGPPLLSTAADVGSTPITGSRIGFDPGPETAPVPTITESSLFADPMDTADDPFLAQLRDAMENEAPPETDDEALSAFFDQEDDDGGRSWFGRRR
jgi:DivIVA domain-containing protein